MMRTANPHPYSGTQPATRFAGTPPVRGRGGSAGADGRSYQLESV